MKSQRAIYLGLFLVCAAAMPLFSGCKRAGNEMGPAAGRQLVVAMSEPPLTLDPVLGLDVASFQLINAIHAPLSLVGSDGRQVMVLGESVTMAEDALSCDIVLKPAKFWDDKQSPVTAEDVRYSFERVRASGNPNRWILDRVAGIEIFDKKEAQHLSGIEIRGERHLTIRLSRPEPDFAQLISSSLTAVTMSGSDKLPKQPLDRQIVGAGPWKPAKFDPGSSFELTANPGFPQRGNAERLVFRVESNAENQMEGVRDGTLDVIRLRGPMIGEACRANESGGLQTKDAFKNVKVVATRANEMTFLKWNWSHPQLAGISEAQRSGLLDAVSARISRDVLAQTLYLGAAEPAYGVVPSTMVPRLAAPKASATSTGFGEKTVTLLAANDPSSRQMAGLLQNELRGVGLKVELSFVDLGGLVQRLIKGDYCICLLWYEQLIPSTGSFAWSLFWTPGAPLNFLGEAIPGLDQPADEARGILGTEERRAAYAKLAGEIGGKQTAWTPLLSRNAVMMVGPRSEGLFLDANGFPYFTFLRVKE